MLNNLRDSLKPTLEKIGKTFAATGLSPNVFTVIGLIFAFVSSIVYGLGYEYSLIIGGIILLVSGFFDIVDGQVARYTKKMSKKGGFLDSVFDKIAEVAIFFGILIGNYADPYLVTTGYASRSRQLGARIEASTRVLSIDIVGGRVKGVVTDKGVVSTDTVVLATGPWSGPLLESVDSDIKLDTVRHQVVLLKHSNALRSSHPIIGDVTLDLSARPDVGGLTMIGVGEDENADPDSFNQGVDMPMVEKTMANMIRRIPSMESAQFIGGWSGLFTTTPDWHPVLDQIEGIKGLYCAVGFSGHGFKLSPMIGKVMSEIIVEGQSTSVDVSRLNASRFKTGNLLESNYRMQVLA